MVEATGDSQIKAIEALYSRLGELLFEVSLILRLARKRALEAQVDTIEEGSRGEGQMVGVIGKTATNEHKCLQSLENNRSVINGYLTLREVATQLNVSLHNVRHWVRDGRLASTRPARHRLVTQEDLRDFLGRNRLAEHPHKPLKLADGSAPLETGDHMTSNPKENTQEQPERLDAQVETLLDSEHWSDSLTARATTVLERVGVDIEGTSEAALRFLLPKIPLGGRIETWLLRKQKNCGRQTARVIAAALGETRSSLSDEYVRKRLEVFPLISPPVAPEGPILKAFGLISFRWDPDSKARDDSYLGKKTTVICPRGVGVARPAPGRWIRSVED
jgi:excisionase family DNA binding protein